MANAFVSHSYIKNLSEAQNHVRYIAFRGRETEDERGGIFSEKSDVADVKNFIKKLDDKKTSHPDVAVAHRLLFSMSGDEWNKSGFGEGDYQKMIRNVMKDYELKTGRKLEWVAAEHRNPDHPHVHVAVKATYQDKDGIHHRLKISNEDRKFFKQAFQQEKNMLRGFELEQHKERPYEQNRPSRGNADFIDNLFRQIEREMREKEREYERGR
ncbi:hypothetical protein OCO53_25590 [Peribacillus frigoritolerans]|uniref:relaxase/mobilization nuclease domain-containing protein n=1 Tax=Peribacillus frigoritolerans TaxID=450367 RepID=UPI0021D02FB6|nr:hypothetical protein [Peribacillus frigoritolerans]MCU6603817.1 hypothetical protein [Peribacillus frigoritolerans]